MQNGFEEALDSLRVEVRDTITQLDGDVTFNLNTMDADIAGLAARSKFQCEQLRVLEGNLELAREVLGAGVELEVDDGDEWG